MQGPADGKPGGQHNLNNIYRNSMAFPLGGGSIPLVVYEVSRRENGSGPRREGSRSPWGQLAGQHQDGLEANEREGLSWGRGQCVRERWRVPPVTIAASSLVGAFPSGRVLGHVREAAGPGMSVIKAEGSRSTERASADGFRALVVDDDLDFRESLALLVSREGFNVSQAASLHEARARLGEQRPDTVFVDMVLPDGNGLDLMEGAHSPGPDFVVITGNVTVEAV